MRTAPARFHTGCRAEAHLVQEQKALSLASHRLCVGLNEGAFYLFFGLLRTEYGSRLSRKNRLSFGLGHNLIIFLSGRVR